MKLYLKQKTVLDEREMQEMYRIEHRGLWAMYTLLCAAVVIQLLFGAEFVQIAGEMAVIAAVSLALIVAYARRGIWDAHARPSTAGNAAYAAMCALGVGVVTLGLRGDALRAALMAAATFALCLALLTALMIYVQHRQREQAEALETDEDEP